MPAAQMHTIGDLILKTAAWFDKVGLDSPRLDAELLLASVMDCDRLRLYLEWSKPLTELEVAAYRELVKQRGQDRRPVARILGKKEFFRLEFIVTDSVFVPRPETEGVVDRALEAMTVESALQVSKPVIFEIGTGSGCIIVTLAHQDATPHFIASEVSPPALATARQNARKHGVDNRVEWREGPGFAGYEGPIHLIVSNPPYIPSGEIPGLPPEVAQHDPMPALDGGADGLDAVRELFAGARDRLVAGGVVVLELGEDQEEAVLGLAADEGIYEHARMERDFAGRPRYFVARRKG